MDNLYLKGMIRGEIDTDYEILANTYATAYDSVNGLFITPAPGQYDPATIKEVNERFRQIKRVARRHAPETLPVINRLEDLTAKHVAGTITDRQYLTGIKKIARTNGIDDHITTMAEAKIFHAERMPVDTSFLSNLRPPAKAPAKSKQPAKHPPTFRDILTNSAPAKSKPATKPKTWADIIGGMAPPAKAPAKSKQPAKVAATKTPTWADLLGGANTKPKQTRKDSFVNALFGKQGKAKKQSKPKGNRNIKHNPKTQITPPNPFMPKFVMPTFNPFAGHKKPRGRR